MPRSGSGSSSPVDDARRLELLQPRGQRVRADAGHALGEVAETQRPEQQVAQDQQRPAVTDHVERGGDAA